MTLWFRRSAVCLVAWLVACGGQRPFPYAKEPDPRRSEYVIGVPDTLRIRVWKNAELNTEVQVRPDGTITLPLIGDVAAANRRPSELKQEITKRLSAFIRADDTTVSVEVSEIESYGITVTGNVARPGVLQSARFLTVGEAITLAGGPNDFADPDDTVVVRVRPNGQIARIPIRYDLIMLGEAPEQDIVLLRGDVIHMP